MFKGGNEALVCPHKVGSRSIGLLFTTATDQRQVREWLCSTEPTGKQYRILSDVSDANSTVESVVVLKDRFETNVN